MPVLGLRGATLALRIPQHVVSQPSLGPGQLFSVRLRDDGTLLVQSADREVGQRAAVNPEAAQAAPKPETK
jgi:antitoxin component of MazEF toxin-antitoxin module